jgi:hypothetical protein
MTGPAEQPRERPDWIPLDPQPGPRATAWPAGLASGVTLLLWGLITSPVLIVVGGLVFGTSLLGWIGEMRHEREG